MYIYKKEKKICFHFIQWSKKKKKTKKKISFHFIDMIIIINIITTIIVCFKLK